MNHYQHQAPIGGSHQDMMMQHKGHHHEGHHHDHHHDEHAHHDHHAHNHDHAHGHHGHNHEHNAHNAHNDHHGHHHHHGHTSSSSPGEPQCSMNMLLNYSTKDLCIFTHHLRIPSDSWALWAAGLVFVFLFVAGYEGLKARARSFDRWVAAEVRRLSPNEGGTDTGGGGGGGVDSTSISSSSGNSSGKTKTTTAKVTTTPQSFARSQKPIRALLHAGTYLYGMLAMLLFMTYNVQVMLACTAGAAAGFLRWAGDVPGGGGGSGGGNAVRGPGQKKLGNEAEQEEEEEEQSAACH